MSIQGNIRTFYLSSLLQLLSNDKKTGVLRVTNGSDTIEISLSEGTIVFASSNHEEERLGNVLVNQGLVAKPIIENCLTTARLSGKKIGDVLIEAHYIGPEALSRAVFQQIEFMIYNLFLWEQGEFEYLDCPVKLPDNATVEFDTMELILEASRRIDEITVLKKHLPGPQEVLVPATGIDTQGLNLKDLELAVLNLVDSRRAVNDIISDSGYDDFSVYRALYSLLSAGIVLSATPSSGNLPAFTFSEKRPVSSTAVECAFPHMPADASGVQNQGVSGAGMPSDVTLSRHQTASRARSSKIGIIAGIMVLLACAAAAVVYLRILPVPGVAVRVTEDPAVKEAAQAQPFTASAPETQSFAAAGKDTLASLPFSLPGDDRQLADSLDAPSHPRPEDAQSHAAVVFKASNNAFTLMLPKRHTVTEKSIPGQHHYFITFTQNVTLSIRVQPWPAPWDPEDEMFRQILDLQNAGGSSRIHTIDSYDQIAVSGATGYEIIYTNSTASLPYKVHTYALMRNNTAVFLDVFCTNYRNFRIRELVAELQKFIKTTLVILA